MSFDYGLGNQRIKTTTTRNSTVERVKYFDVDYEEDSTSSGVKKYHYINGGTGLTAIFVKEGSGNDTMYHILSDHLGSLTTIVNASSNEVKNFSYNAWGIPRDADDWTSEYSGELFAGRGFTGHEHLAEFNLINMNGRIYDPVLGRFLSPDPFIQAPQYPNSYNRYSYALNNPLRFIDPSGYKHGPTDYEREQINGEHTYYNWEMAWKLGGDGRLHPDPYTWNNIGRYHHTPGPTGTTTDENGNVVDTYQDPITGGEYYKNKVGGYTVPYYSDEDVEGYADGIVISGIWYRLPGKYKDAGVEYIPLYERVFLDAVNSGNLSSLDDMSYWEMIRRTDFPEPIMGMPPPIVPGGVQIKALRTILKSWSKVNWRSVSSAVKYHYSKHVLNQGMRNNLMQYTDDALKFFNTNKHLGKEVMLRDGSMGMKIRLGPNQPGGIFTTDGRIVSFWYY